ncbi:MAG: hypothetical protein NZ878_00305, partial [SAR324 cluster bacterium]|nr:hypothetical protein [SAR324 cluster bacterium]
LSGGTLQADNDTTVKSDLASQADSIISVAAGKEITYSGNTLNIGAHSLTLSGSGSFENTGTLALDNSTSILSLNGISKVKNISVTGDLTTGKLEAAQDSQIDTLSLSGSSRIDIAGQKTLTLASAVEIPVNKSMELIGSGGGTISLGDNLTLTGDMKISAADTIQGSTLALNGGSLQVGQDTSIASDLIHQSSSEIEVSAGKTLTYTGSAVNIEDSTLTISGGGKFTNSQDLVFNHTASVLNLNGIAEINKVKFPGSLTTGKLIAAEDVSIQSLTHTGGSIIDIASGKTLTVKDDFGIASNKSMVMIGSGGTLKLDNTLTLSGTLQMDGQSKLESGILSFDSGILSVNQDSTISSALNHVGSSTIQISSGKRLKLESGFTVPELIKMNLTGSGGVLELEDSLTVAGTLEFAVPHTLDSGTVALNGGTLNVKQDVSVSSAVTHSLDSTVDVSTGSTLTLTGGDIDVGAKTLTLSGGGSVANQDQLILNDPKSILKLGGIASVNNVSMPATFSTGKLEVSEDAIVKNLLNSGLS